MKKIITSILLVFFMAAVVGCGGASKNDGGTSENESGEDSMTVFVEDDGTQDDFSSGAGTEDDFGYDDGTQDDSGSDDGIPEEDFDYDAWLQEYSGDTADSGYQNYKDVYRDCTGVIDTAISRFFEMFDADFYNSDAAVYHQYMNYYGSLCSPLERIFSGNDEKIEKALKEGFYAEDIAWSVDGGSAVITFTAENENVTVTVEYDGFSTADITYAVDGEIRERASFITNDRYDIIAYSYSTMTLIDAVYANGDAYYIYDPSGSSVEFSVYNGTFDDPSELIGDRSYIAIIDGVLVY